MGNLETLHILIVEDDPIMQLVSERKLDTMHVKHTSVSNGIEAIEALKSKKFDCVLMDINMPQQDGIDTVRWIRDSQDEYYKNLPIFALTTYATQDHTAEILEAGMNGHLVKPLDIDQFKELYDNFIKSRKA